MTSGTLGKVGFKATSAGEFKVALRNIIFFTDAGVFTIPDVTYKIVAHKLVTETKLLQNFPNPFNPETWIPFQLASGQQVSVRIFDNNGRLIRHLALGELPTGLYLQRNRAAYWDGRNNAGERVASGIYFYQLTAGKLSKVKRMIVVK